jgi:hypothetical protein
MIALELMTKEELIAECLRVGNMLTAERKVVIELQKRIEAAGPALTNESAYTVVKEGQQARIDGTPAKYPPLSVLNVLYIVGWVQEDLRIALMRVDPVYRAGQDRFKGYQA